MIDTITLAIGLSEAEAHLAHFLAVFELHHFDRTATANHLQITIRTLRSRLKQYRAMGADIPYCPDASLWPGPTRKKDRCPRCSHKL